MFRRRREDEERKRELEDYLARETEENIAQGMAPEEARRVAHVKLGSTRRIREEIREMNGIGFLETLWLDVKYAARMLRKSPGFTTVAVLTLALGIGANTAIFSVVNTALLSQLPYRYADRIVWITEVRPDRSDAPFSLPDFLDYRDHVASLDSLSAMGSLSVNLTGSGVAERLNAVRASANLFETLGVSAAAGRTLEPEDDRPGNPRVVVLTHGFWQRRFGGDTSSIGRHLELNGMSYTLVGVLPQNFVLPVPNVDLVLPLVPDADPWRFNRDSTNFLRLVGRVRPGATVASAQAEMNALAVQLRQQFPVANARKLGVKLTLIRDQMTGGYRRALLVLLAAVGFVLLVACANLANLNLVRASARRREMAILSALGATRWKIVKRLLSESALIGVGGGILGVVFASFGLQGLLALAPSTLPRAPEPGLNLWVLGFAAVVSLAAVIITGLVPAMSVTRDDLAQQLNEGSRGSTEGRGGKALRNGLVAVEVVLSLILLAGAGLLLKSFAKVQQVDPGFDPHNILTVRLSLPGARYPHLTDITKFYEALLPRVQALPGVTAAGVTHILPMSGLVWSINFTVMGRAFTKEEIPEAQYRIVSPGYLKAMGIRLLAGREFSESDTDHRQLVCYVNERLARRFWPQGSAVGAHLMLDDSDSGLRQADVVGIIHDVKDRGLDASPSFDIYIPLRQAAEDSAVWLQSYQFWALRTSSDPLALADTFRQQVRKVDADVAGSDVRSMDQYFSMAIAPRRFNLQILSVFAIAALALAVAGIYGVISYTVNLRAHEIGIRMSLGAQRGDILRLVITDGMKPVLMGLTLGILGVFALTKELTSLLFMVSASDPATLAGVTLLFGGASLAALYIPARRAAGIDPLAVLRAE